MDYLDKNWSPFTVSSKKKKNWLWQSSKMAGVSKVYLQDNFLAFYLERYFCESRDEL